MTCKKCGADLNEGVEFCENCGAEILTEETLAVEETTSEEIVAAEEAVSEEMKQEGPAAEEVCKNCGIPIEDGSAFCPQCGAKYAEDEPKEEEPSFCANCGAKIEEDVMYCTNCGEPLRGKEEKTGGKLLSVLKKVNIPVIVAIILVLSIVAFAAPVIKNSVVKTFTSPEGYFKHVVSGAIDDIAEDVADVYGIIKDHTVEDAGMKGEIEIETGDGLENLLSEIDEGFDFKEIEWFETAGMDFSLSNRKNVMSADMEIKLNGEKIATLDIINDMENMGTYMAIPELSSTYLYTDMDPYDYNSGVTEEVNKVLEILPGEKTAEKLLKKYMECIVDGVTKVEESKETIKAGNVSQKVTALTATIDSETIIASSKNVLEEVRKDKEIKKIIKDFSKLENANISYDDFVEAVDSALEEIKNTDPDDLYFDEIEITIYVNNKGELAGMEFDYEDVKIEAYVAKKGSKIGTYLKVRASGAAITFEGEGKMSGDKVSGDFALNVMGVDAINISLDKLDMEKLKDGVTNGKITLSASDDLAEMAPEYENIISDITLIIEGSSKSVDDIDEKIIVKYDDEVCAKLEAKATDKGAKKAEIPKDFVDTNDYEEMEEWTENADTDKLIKALEKAGLPDEFIEMMEYQLG